MPRTVLVFDGDDTLWQTEFLYDRARDRSAAIVQSAGIDADEFRDTQRSIDVENVATFGLSRTRFPTSSKQAYKFLVQRYGHIYSDEIAKAVYESSASVFTEPAPLYQGVQEVLQELSPKFHLALLTKGDIDIQKTRLRDSGLRPYFEYVSIVDEKGVHEFGQVLIRMEADAKDSWSIGNSLRSDIKPAVDLGMRAIWIDQYVWAHEAHRVEAFDHPGVYLASDIAQVPRILKAQAAKPSET